MRGMDNTALTVHCTNVFTLMVMYTNSEATLFNNQNYSSVTHRDKSQFDWNQPLTNNTHYMIIQIIHLKQIISPYNPNNYEHFALI